jgi:hypothetical protein
VTEEALPVPRYPQLCADDYHNGDATANLQQSDAAAWRTRCAGAAWATWVRWLGDVIFPRQSTQRNYAMTPRLAGQRCGQITSQQPLTDSSCNTTLGRAAAEARPIAAGVPLQVSFFILYRNAQLAQCEAEGAALYTVRWRSSCEHTAVRR